MQERKEWKNKVQFICRSHRWKTPFWCLWAAKSYIKYSGLGSWSTRMMMMMSVVKHFLYNWSAQRKVISGNVILKGKSRVPLESRGWGQGQACYQIKREKGPTILREEKSSGKGEGRIGWEPGVEKSAVSKMWPSQQCFKMNINSYRQNSKNDPQRPLTSYNPLSFDCGWNLCMWYHGCNYTQLYGTADLNQADYPSKPDLYTWAL